MSPTADSQAGAGDGLDCLVPDEHGQWVRGFIKLPSGSTTGELRLVEDLEGIQGELAEPLQFLIQDSGTGTPGYITDGFVTRQGISMPVPAAYPLVIHVNRAVVGSKKTDLTHKHACVSNVGLLDFFEIAKISQEEAATANSVVIERQKGEFGPMDLSVSEVTERVVDRTSLRVDWRGEVALSGEPCLLDDWVDPLVKALHLFSFCIDRPLQPERIYSSDGPDEIALHVGWRETAAPESTVPLLTQQLLSTPFPKLVSSWWKLWDRSPDLLDHVTAFQVRRDNLTLDDKLLVLARTLELYHAQAARFTSTIRTKEEQKAFRDTILSALPEALAKESKSIKKNLDEGNRKRFAAQIADILVDLDTEVMEACGILISADEFGGIVAATRNFFTHPKKKRPKKVPAGRDLMVLVHRLWFVIRAGVLVELGLSRSDIAKALNRSRMRHYLVAG